MRKNWNQESSGLDLSSPKVKAGKNGRRAECSPGHLPPLVPSAAASVVRPVPN